jgi:hypothetical protein
VCFSAAADVSAGVLVGVVGVDAVRHVEHRRELALASLPIAFAAHQLAEAVVWSWLGGRVPPSTGHVALWLYLVFALAVVPVLVPSAVLAVEPDVQRRAVMAWCVTVAAVLAAVYLWTIVRGPVAVRIDGHRLVYRVHLDYGGLASGVYICTTAVAMLASSHRRVVAFGMANAAAAGVLARFASSALISLWCAWAALTSAAIALHLRQARPHGDPGGRVPRSPVAPPLRAGRSRAAMDG